MKSADGRVATVVTRRRKNLVQHKNDRIDLTPTGLLMEGDYTQNRFERGVTWRFCGNHRGLCRPHVSAIPKHLRIR
jgi:hypothetical protein